MDVPFDLFHLLRFHIEFFSLLKEEPLLHEKANISKPFSLLP